MTEIKEVCFTIAKNVRTWWARSTRMAWRTSPVRKRHARSGAVELIFDTPAYWGNSICTGIKKRQSHEFIQTIQRGVAKN